MRPCSGIIILSKPILNDTHYENDGIFGEFFNPAQHLSSSKSHEISLGLLPNMWRLAAASLDGAFFSLADAIIDMIERQTLLVLRAGVQSESSVDRQMWPLE